MVLRGALRDHHHNLIYSFRRSPNTPSFTQLMEQLATPYQKWPGGAVICRALIQLLRLSDPHGGCDWCRWTC